MASISLKKNSGSRARNKFKYPTCRPVSAVTPVLVLLLPQNCWITWFQGSKPICDSSRRQISKSLFAAIGTMGHLYCFGYQEVDELLIDLSICPPRRLRETSIASLYAIAMWPQNTRVLTSLMGHQRVNSMFSLNMSLLDNFSLEDDARSENMFSKTSVKTIRALFKPRLFSKCCCSS